MGKDVADAYPVAAETFAEADAVLGFPLSRICFEGPAERLDQTDIQQPAVFTMSVAVYRAAVSTGRIQPERIGVMGGLSLGEYTALHVAGAIPFKDAVHLLYARGRLMQEAADRVPSGMVSLVGADEAKALAICAQARPKGRIWPANYNCPGQIVVSGERAACEEVLRLADGFGLRAVPLKVAGAFHCELMRPAADGLRPLLERCEIRRPSQRVLSNVDATYHADPGSIREALYQQTVSPVRWQACVERMLADGCREFFEVGPGRTLTGMMRKIDRSLPATNISTVSDVQLSG